MRILSVTSHPHTPSGVNLKTEYCRTQGFNKAIAHEQLGRPDIKDPQKDQPVESSQIKDLGLGKIQPQGLPWGTLKIHILASKLTSLLFPGHQKATFRIQGPAKSVGRILQGILACPPHSSPPPQPSFTVQSTRQQARLLLVPPPQYVQNWGVEAMGQWRGRLSLAQSRPDFDPSHAIWFPKHHQD